jgi:ribonuclease P protein component
VPGATFSKRLRLCEPAQFRAVFDAAELRLSAGEILLLARSNALGHPRLGIVIGRKACKLAVGRNRFKRTVRESYRLRQQEFAGMDIIVLARSGIAVLDRTTLNQRVSSLWTRLSKRLAHRLPASDLLPAPSSD